MSKQFTIKPMTIEDYDGLHALWMTIHGFGIRSIDDSREGVERFIHRNPGTDVRYIITHFILYFKRFAEKTRISRRHDY